MENTFLLLLAIVGISAAFCLGFLVQLLYIRVTKGSEAAKQFFKEEF